MWCQCYAAVLWGVMCPLRHMPLRLSLLSRKILSNYDERTEEAHSCGSVVQFLSGSTTTTGHFLLDRIYTHAKVIIEEYYSRCYNVQ